MAYNDGFGNMVESVSTGTQGFTSLLNIGATGPGTAFDMINCRNNHTMVVTSGAGVSAGVVQLQGSLDGTNWFNMLGTSSVTTNAASTTFPPVHIVNSAVRFLRANITTIITGGTITAVVGSSS